MQDPSFEHLAEEAAAGLKVDRELFLEVKEELHSHLEEKSLYFMRQGKSAAESAELSCKSFGSPLDVAAELLEANRGRIRLRGLLRLTFGALIVPLAIVLALYLGYGRFARVIASLQNIGAVSADIKLPTLPCFGVDADPDTHAAAVVRQLRGNQDNKANILHYWEAHRKDKNSYIYYAYYVMYLNYQYPGGAFDMAQDPPDEHDYVQAMHLGEQLEPGNALYNILLANYYLIHGILPKESSGEPDKVMNRRMFELGIMELRNAARKPYIREYGADISRIRLRALPRPVITEDYLRYLAVDSEMLWPMFARTRELVRHMSGCARVLAATGRRDEAMSFVNAWKPLMLLWAGDSETSPVACYVSAAIGSILEQRAAEVYTTLGAMDKARDARAHHERLTQIVNAWRTELWNVPHSQAMVQQHGSRVASTLNYPFFGSIGPTVAELTPQRMLEHVWCEEVTVQLLLIGLTLALLSTLLQGYLWLFRLRRSGAVPLLLMPSAWSFTRALLLGMVLPMLLYWLYSRCPVLGGREYGWGSVLWPRFAAELLLVGWVICWLPAHLLWRGIRRRCVELGITLPEAKEERAASRIVRGGMLAAFLLLAAALLFTGVSFRLHQSARARIGDVHFALLTTGFSPLLRLAGILLALGVAVLGFRFAVKRRQQHGLYYGTLARSLAPVYAFAILLLALLAQPWLMYNEAAWLQQDRLVFGYRANPSEHFTGCSDVETRAAQHYAALLRQALESNNETMRYKDTGNIAEDRLSYW